MPRIKKNPLEAKKVKIKEQRIPMIKLLKDKDLRTAAKNLEDFRLKFREEEILYGATLTVKYDNWTHEFKVVAERFETTEETLARVEKERLAAEAKKRREAEKKAAEAKREADRLATEQRKAFDMIHELARKHGIHPRDLVDKWTV
jgi:hypothetical protein